MYSLHQLSPSRILDMCVNLARLCTEDISHVWESSSHTQRLFISSLPFFLTDSSISHSPSECCISCCLLRYFFVITALLNLLSACLHHSFELYERLSIYCHLHPYSVLLSNPRFNQYLHFFHTFH